MGQRFEGSFYSDIKSILYTVKIHDEDYTGAVLDMTIDNLVMVAPHEGSNRSNPIITTAYEVRISNDSAAIDTFITVIVGSEELRFNIQVY